MWFRLLLFFACAVNFCSFSAPRKSPVLRRYSSSLEPIPERVELEIGPPKVMGKFLSLKNEITGEKTTDPRVMIEWLQNEIDRLKELKKLELEHLNYLKSFECLLRVCSCFVGKAAQQVFDLEENQSNFEQKIDEHQRSIEEIKNIYELR
ncbi:hypothetical protein FJ366_00695 [Candidatus Dependentiae bacterium]|nr:hypothetical protein [Candidatus Dependentiae bacterium]